MHPVDSDTAERNRRVQELCRQLTDLVRLSSAQRREIDHLLDDLEKLASRLPEPLKVRRAGAAAHRTGPVAASVSPSSGSSDKR